MSPISFNFGSSENRNKAFEPAPAGTYAWRVSNTEVKTSQKGNDYINTEVEIIENDEYQGKKSWIPLTLVEESAPYVAQFMEALYDEPYEGEQEIDPFDMVGRKFMAYTTIEEYQNSKGQWVKKNNIAPWDCSPYVPNPVLPDNDEPF